jgi:hypothetical protein
VCKAKEVERFRFAEPEFGTFGRCAAAERQAARPDAGRKSGGLLAARSPYRSDLAPAPFASSVAAERYFKHLGVKKSLYCGGVMRDEPGTASIAC